MEFWDIVMVYFLWEVIALPANKFLKHSSIRVLRDLRESTVFVSWSGSRVKSTFEANSLRRVRLERVSCWGELSLETLLLWLLGCLLVWFSSSSLFSSFKAK